MSGGFLSCELVSYMDVMVYVIIIVLIDGELLFGMRKVVILVFMWNIVFILVENLRVIFVNFE